MKFTNIVGCACLLVSPSVAFAQSIPTNSRTLGLDVKNVGSGFAAASTNTLTKSTTTRESTRRYDVEVRNLTPLPADTIVEVYVFAKRFVLTDNGKRSSRSTEPFLFESKTLPVSLGASQSRTISFIPKPMTVKNASSSNTQSATIGNIVYIDSWITSVSTKRSGDAMAGWLVRLVTDGVVVATKGSEPSYAELGRDANKLRMQLPPDRVYSPKDMIMLFTGLTSAEVIQLIGKPSSTLYTTSYPNTDYQSLSYLAQVSHCYSVSLKGLIPIRFTFSPKTTQKGPVVQSIDSENRPLDEIQ